MNKRVLLLLSFGHLVTDTSQGILPIFLSVLKEQMGLSYTQLGLAVLLFNVCSSVIQPLFGYWSDRGSYRWLLPLGVLVSGVGMGLAGIAPSFPLLLLFVLISGLGIASYHPEGSKTAHYASGRLVASSMAVFSVGGNIGVGLGPIMANLLLTLWGLKASPLLAAPAGLTAILFWLYLPTIARETEARELAERAATRKEGARRAIPYGALTLLVAVVILRSWLSNGLTNYIPLYYINYLHGNPTFASTLLSIFLISGAAGTLLGGRVADSIGPRRMIILSLALVMPLTLAFPRLEGPLVVVAVAVIGFFLISTFATTIVMAQALIPQYVGMASGLMIGFSLGTGGIGVTLMGLVADRVSVPFAISLLAVAPALAVILALFLPDTTRRPAQAK